MPLYNHEKQARKPKTFWGKMQDVFSSKTSAQPLQPKQQKFVDHRSLEALQASQPKKSKGSDGQRTDKSNKRDQAAGHRHLESRKEAADFLSAGAHRGLKHTTPNRGVAQDEALKKLTNEPPKATLRQKIKADYKHHPTSNDGPNLQNDVDSYLRRQGGGKYTYKPPVDPSAPPRKPTKADRGKDIPVKNIREVPKHQPAVVHRDRKQHISTELERSSPVSPLTPGGDRITKWQDFYSLQDPVSPMSPLLPPLPTLPKAVAKSNQPRAELDRKKTKKAPPTLPNAAIVHKHREDVIRTKKVPPCQLCPKDSFPDQQLTKLGYNLCKSCAKAAFLNPKSPKNAASSSALPPKDNGFASFDFDYQQAQNAYSPPATARTKDKGKKAAAGLSAPKFTEFDETQAQAAYSPPFTRSVDKGKGKAVGQVPALRYTEIDPTQAQAAYSPPTTARRPTGNCPRSPTQKSTPWIEGLKPSAAVNPLNPTTYLDSEHSLIHTYSTIFAQAKAQPAPPVPTLSSLTSRTHNDGVQKRSKNGKRPVVRRTSSIYSQALPPGTLPPSTFDPNPPPMPTPPALPYSAKKEQKISTSTDLPPPSLPPLGPLPLIPTAPSYKASKQSIYDPIAWRTDPKPASKSTVPNESFKEFKRKPVLAPLASNAIINSTREKAAQYGVKMPEPASSEEEEEWRRSSGFYEFWGELLGYTPIGISPPSKQVSKRR